ncbi:MAG: GtrA family protein [Polymorphobacter sp.]
MAPARTGAAAQQARRFIVVGLANASTTYVVIWLLHMGFGQAVWFASAAGYAVGVVQGFILSRSWSFAGSQGHPVLPQMALFIGANLLCIGIFSQATVWLDRWLSLPLATFAATIVVMPVSFALYRWVVFRKSRGAAS